MWLVSPSPKGTHTPWFSISSCSRTSARFCMVSPGLPWNCGRPCADDKGLAVWAGHRRRAGGRRRLAADPFVELVDAVHLNEARRGRVVLRLDRQLDELVTVEAATL